MKIALLSMNMVMKMTKTTGQGSIRKGWGGTPLTDKIRKVVFDPFPKEVIEKNTDFYGQVDRKGMGGDYFPLIMIP